MPPDSPEIPDAPRPIGEIAQGPSAFEQFLDRNQKNLVILTILIALAAAGWVIYRGIARSKEHTAGAELSKAEDTTALQSVVKDHAGTAAADSAQVLLAARQWQEGQQDAAIATLKAFIAANSDHPARPTAQASLGSKLQAQSKLADAKKVFQEIADDPTARFLAPYALLSLGDMAKAAGETAQATKFYQKAKTDFPDSSFSSAITQRISLLQAQFPVEIDPPAPPAAAAAATPPAAAQPAVTGAPRAEAGTPEADVPPVNNPYMTEPGGKPAANTAPAAETPPTAPPAPAPAAGAPPPPSKP